MLDPVSWIEAAKELTLGQRRRVNHDCGSGRTMIVKHGDNGYDAYCWRCSDEGFIPHPQPSMAERLARLTKVRQLEAEVEADTRPPMPANFDPSTWPLEARVWLYKAGFSNEHIQRIGLYYNERLRRVVIPVLDGLNICYWQARGFDPDRPKYLNPPIDKTRLMARYGGSGPVVLTEDALSSARIGDAGARGWAILGTALSDAQAGAVAASGAPCAVWLDDDDAGRRATSKVIRKLRLLGVDAQIIRTQRDPKLLSKQEIEQCINRALY